MQANVLLAGLKQCRHLPLGQPDGTVGGPKMDIGAAVFCAVQDQFAFAVAHAYSLVLWLRLGEVGDFLAFVVDAKIRAEAGFCAALLERDHI